MLESLQRTGPCSTAANISADLYTSRRFIKIKIKSSQRKVGVQRRRYRYDLFSSTAVTGSVSDAGQRRCIALALFFYSLSR